MSYCYDHGIPYSVFMGRIVGNTDPMWLESDIERVVAYTIWKAEICPLCGTKESDWIGEDGLPLPEPKYEAATVLCYGCREKEILNEHVPSHEKGIHTICRERAIGTLNELAKMELNKAEARRMQKGLESLPTW